MSPEDLAPGTYSPAADTLRSLWLDYLGTLNDRELHSRRASGATTWALLAVAAAIVYRCVQRLPDFLAIPRAMESGGVVFLLQLDASLYICFALFLVLYYMRGRPEGRVLPELQKRARWVQDWIVIMSMLAIVTAHFWVATKLSGPVFVRGTLVGIGLWWALNITAAITSRVRKILKAKKYRIPLPVFSATWIPPTGVSLVLAAVLFSFGVTGAVGLVSYVHHLGHSRVLSVVLLGGVSQVLGLSAILLFLIFRALHSLPRDIYVELERAILLENLSLDEIKKRFIQQALGASIADWLKDVEDAEKASEARLASLRESAQIRLEEIASSYSQYPHERKARARELLEEYEKGLADARLTQMGLLHQIRELSGLHKTRKEDEVMRNVLEQWKTRIDQLMQSARELLTKLMALANPPDVSR